MSNATTVICLSPQIDESFLLSQRIKRDIDEPQEEVTFHIWFILDGVEEYNEENFNRSVPDSSELTIYANPPDVEHWDEVIKHKAGDSITVYGEEVNA